MQESTNFSVVERPTGFLEVMGSIAFWESRFFSLSHACDFKIKQFNLIISYVLAKQSVT